MMKDVTILTFDEVERIRNDIDNMIDNAKYGLHEKFNPKDVCSWLIQDLKKLREQFE